MNVVEFVVLLVEAVSVDENHLQESVGQILHGERKEVADGTEDPFALIVCVGKGNESNALLKIRAAEEILVAAGYEAEILIRLQILNVSLHERRVILDVVVKTALVGDDAVKRLIHRARSCP